MAAEGWLGVTCTPAPGDILQHHQYDVTVNFQIGFNYGGKNGYGASYSITCDGQTQNGTATFSVPSANGQGMKWANIGTKTFRVTMDKSGLAKTISISAGINTGVSPSYVSASTTYTLNAVTWEWTVSYNANGGSGDIYTDYVQYKSAYTTRANWFKRTGHTFTGWNEAANGSGTSWTNYINKPWTWTYTKSITLFAQWKINTYTVSYNANGGSGAPGSQTKTFGQALTLSGTKPTRPNYTFKGWSPNKSAVSAEYTAGGSYYTDSSVTLYAVWELAYWSPKINNISLARCNSDGTLNSYGTYVKVVFNWECCQIIGSNPIGSITVGYATIGSTTFTNTAVTASGNKGTSSVVIGDNKLSVDNQYNIQITIIDSKKGTSASTYPLSAAAFTIDFKSGGKGVAIGKPADTDNLFDVKWATRIRDTLTVNKNATVGGLTIGNNQVNDYVIAQGRSGIWTYRKWNSGFAECWCTASNKVATDTKWGNVYYYQALQGGYALPFTFIQTGDFQDDPQGFVDIQTPGGNYSFQIANRCTTTAAPKGYVMCPVQQTSGIETYFTFYIRGRWKK
jgi:uncharacterized repeat protein (TIGR02543 family)